MCVCMYVCMHVCMYVLCMYVCMYVCMYALMSGAPIGYRTSSIRVEYFDRLVCMYVCMYILPTNLAMLGWLNSWRAAISLRQLFM